MRLFEWGLESRLHFSFPGSYQDPEEDPGRDVIQLKIGNSEMEITLLRRDDAGIKLVGMPFGGT